MQGGNHCCFGDARNQALIDRRSRCDTQRMAIQTSFAKKVTRFQNTYDCFLAPLGNDGELDLALLNIKNRVRLAALRKNNLVLVILRLSFSHRPLWREIFWIKCRPHTLLHGESRFSPDDKKGQRHGEFLSPPGELRTLKRVQPRL